MVKILHPSSQDWGSSKMIHLLIVIIVVIVFVAIILALLGHRTYR